MIGDLLRRSVAVVMAALLVCPPWPTAANAKPPRKTPDTEVQEVTQQAEALLNKLEYERAREMLESAVLNPQFRKAKPTWRAKLWAMLGWARAEVGDAVGTDEAFLQAVQFDRRVKLSKGTSPKILEALERARLNAPLPGDGEGKRHERAGPEGAAVPHTEKTAEPHPAAGSAGEKPEKKRKRSHKAEKSGEAEGQGGTPAGAEGGEEKAAGKGVADKGAGKPGGEKAAGAKSADKAAGTASGEKGAGTKGADKAAGTASGDKGADKAAGTASGEKSADKVAGSASGDKSADKVAGSASGEKAAGTKGADTGAGRASNEKSADKAGGTATGEKSADKAGGTATGEKSADKVAGTASGEKSADKAAADKTAGKATKGTGKTTDEGSADNAEPPKARIPTLRQRVEGRIALNKTITIVIEHENLPKNAHVELEVRRSQTGGYHTEPLTKSGTVSIRKLKLDRPRLEFYARALKGKKVVAQVGSYDDPIVVSTLPPAPSIADAWSVEEPKVRLLPGTGSSSASAGQAGARPATGKTRTASTAAAKPLPTVRTSTAIAVVKPTIVAKDDSDDNTGLIIGLAAGGAALAAAGTILLIVLLKSGKPDCSAKEGFGCTEVQIHPLTAF